MARTWTADASREVGRKKGRNPKPHAAYSSAATAAAPIAQGLLGNPELPTRLSVRNVPRRLDYLKPNVYVLNHTIDVSEEPDEAVTMMRAMIDSPLCRQGERRAAKTLLSAQFSVEAVGVR